MLEELTAGFPILSCILFLPVVGAAVLWLFDDEDMVGPQLTIALVELALSVFVLCVSCRNRPPCSLQNVCNGFRP